MKKIINLKHIVLIPITLAYLYLMILPLQSNLLLIELDRSPVRNAFMIQYDNGSGFDDKKSMTVNYPVMEKSFEMIFSFPGSNLKQVKIFTGTSEVEMGIKSIILKTGLFTSKKWMPEDIIIDFKPVDLIQDYRLQDGLVRFKVTGYDPCIESSENFEKIFRNLAFKANLIYKIILSLIFLFIIAVFYFKNRIFERYLFLRTKSGFKITLGFISLLLVVFLLSRSGLTFASIGYSLELLWSAAILILIGLIFSYCFKGLWYRANGNFFPMHSLLIGQLFVVFYIYIRSYLNHIIGFVIPITFIDFPVMIALGAFILQKRKVLPELIQDLKQYKFQYLGIIMVLWGALLIVVINDLPQIRMLSSDSTIHAFLAKQIERFHTLPISHSFNWGDAGITYPSGFAVLNFMWSSLSLMDVRNIVTAQVLMQTFFAILLMFEVVLIVKGIQFLKEQYKTFILVIMGVFAFYLFVIPYGYHHKFIYLVNTPRISSLFFLTGILSFLAILMAYFRKKEEKADFKIIQNGLIVVLLILFLAFINPTYLMYPLALVFIILILHIIHLRGKKAYLYFFLIPFFIFVFLDPYFSEMIKSNFKKQDKIEQSVNQPNSQKSDETTEKISSKAFFMNQLSDKIKNLKKSYEEFSTVKDLLKPWQTSIIIGILFLMIVLLRYFKRLDPGVFWFLILFPIVLFLIYLLIMPFSLTLEDMKVTAYHILVEYVDSARGQFLILWILLSMIFVLSSMVQLRFYQIFLPLLLAVFMIIEGSFTLKQVNLFFNQKEFFYDKTQIYQPRNKFGKLFGDGVIYQDDLKVIRQIEDFYHKEKLEKKFTSKNIPKILIPNAIYHQIAQEKGLGVYGATLILPFYETFPLAFFYGQADSAYTVENYQEKICKSFDENWLKSKNIKYIFIATDYAEKVEYPVCVFQLDELKKNKKIIFQQGNTYFIELYQ